MIFEQIMNQLLDDTVQRSLPMFSPELVLCGTILLLLAARLFSIDRWIPGQWTVLCGAFVAFVLAFLQFQELASHPDFQPTEFFTGLLIYDHFGIAFRLFLLFFLVFVIVLTILSGIPDQEDSPDFYTLLCGATLGMMLMASANHLLILFLSVEMTSVPSYVMVGFLKGRRKSSEAALKYVVYGAGAAGVMLYGISLIAGLLGTAGFPEISVHLGRLVTGEAGLADPTVRVVLIGVLLVFVGLAFKLSLFPFHFWCPDAFEGASAEVCAFLSVASKAGAFALLVRFCLTLVGDATAGLAGVNMALGIALGVIGAVTATYGNLTAYTQQNIKRLLAYSTIAHAGYMVMAVAAMMVLLNAPASSGISPDEGEKYAAYALQSLMYYLTVYLFMNLGAFAIVAVIRNHTYGEDIEDYEGLGFETPVLCVCMTVCLFSLVGIPPLGGFVGKFGIFWSVFKAGEVHWSMWVVLCVAGLNTVFSLFYYVRIVKAMFFVPRAEGARPVKIKASSATGAYALMVSIPVLLLGIIVEPLSDAANHVATILMR